MNETTDNAEERSEFEARVDPFWDKNEELLGLLFSVNQKLSDTGTGIMSLAFFLYLAFITTLFFDLGAAYGYSLLEYDSWLTYVVVLIVGVLVSGFLAGVQEKLVFRRHAAKLDTEMAQNGISPLVVIAKIEKSPGLELQNVVEKLKKAY